MAEGVKRTSPLSGAFSARAGDGARARTMTHSVRIASVLLIDAGGVPDISRGLSEATPPELDANCRGTPKGCQKCARGNAARCWHPSGVRRMTIWSPGVSARDARLNPRLIAVILSGCLAGRRFGRHEMVEGIAIGTLSTLPAFDSRDTQADIDHPGDSTKMLRHFKLMPSSATGRAGIIALADGNGSARLPPYG